MTPTIPFTQYLLPNGQKLQQFFDCYGGLIHSPLMAS